MDKFDPNAQCVIPRSFLKAQYSCWQVIASADREFAALGNKVKSFATTGNSSHPVQLGECRDLGGAGDGGPDPPKWSALPELPQEHPCAKYQAKQS